MPIAFIREAKLINCNCHTSTIVIKYCIIEPRHNNERFQTRFYRKQRLPLNFSNRVFASILPTLPPRSPRFGATERVPFSPLAFNPRALRLPGLSRDRRYIRMRVFHPGDLCWRIMWQNSTVHASHRHASRTMQRLWFIEWRAGAADLTLPRRG